MSDSFLSATPVRALDAQAVAHQLKRLAGGGDPPWLHREVARRMAERLSFIKLKPDRVIDWWSHLGASAQVLAQACPRAQRALVEPTPALRARGAATSAPWWSSRRWRMAPPRVLFEDDVPDASAQLVWANMMLHACASPPAVFARWQRALEVGGFVMFSTLGPDTLRELRELYRHLAWPPPAADFVDMHDLGDMLVHAGFADPVMDQEPLTLTWPSAQAALDELRGLGGNVHPQRFPGLRTPRWRAQLHDALRGLADADGRLHLRFEIVYGHAFKTLPRPRVAEHTRVSLDDMKAMVRRRGA
jgi:malonyl-CoA O-methyltransferase